jgi:D-alanyl-D-alanine endopeptidase (penicillin-binding protein 7)
MRRLLSSLVLFAILSCGSSIVHAKSVSITAKSWLVADEQGRVIQGENTTAVRPIASISKLVTAMVVLDAKQDPNETIGKYTRNDLMQMMLVKSDNQAAVTLCDNYPGGRDECVRAMNLKVKALDLHQTKFIEPTGLSIMNISTATELIQIVLAAKEYPDIVRASRSPDIKIKIRKKWLVFRNTNPIIGRYHNFLVSKTGYINASGGCIVMMLDTDIGRRIVVVLGSKNTRTRIPEAEFIAKTY